MAEEVAKILEELKKIPGWDRFPLPECVYKEFNIKKPKQYDGLMDWANDSAESMFAGGEGSWEVETRPPVEGGIRTLGELPKPEIEIKLNQPENNSADTTKVTITDTNQS